MASNPFFEGDIGGQAATLIDALAETPITRPPPELAIDIGRPGRQMCVYPARAGYDLQAELDFLANRMIEPNVFFTGRFLAPAMPRLDDRQVRLLLIRDEAPGRSRLRMVMPFSIERPGFSVGPSIIRAWSHPFGPLGTPLVDAEGAAETLDNFLEALAGDDTQMPNVLVLPDMRIDGPAAELLRAVALARGLTVETTEAVERPVLRSSEEPERYLRGAIRGRHLKEMRRQWRHLAAQGTLVHKVARQPLDVRIGLEQFLALEASGWKGQRRSAMVSDRYRAAFAREAVTNQAENDNARIHVLEFDGRAIAVMVVFVIAGQAFTWKTAYDERFAASSPGKLLFWKLTEQHLDDPNIQMTDSCAVPDHPIASRLWEERERMATMIIGLDGKADRQVRQVARQLHLYRNTRNVARILRERVRALARRKSAAKN
ncbi:GNAT family N-acetyltransferase [Georhizobium sp. MAB10]|uniref:GNAT family N-acetyltransferase n=1 Tax=Georhizobium sp. MAB10 TaxID=3028319 RepID=UPI0038559A96